MSDKRALEVPATHRPAATLSNVKGKRDAPSLPANVTCLHSTQTNRSEPTMCVSGMPGAQSCKCSCEVTFSQPKHSFVIMVATPFWNSGEIRGIARDGAADQVERHNRIVAQSRATRHGTARHQEKPDPPWARLFRAQGVSGATAPADVTTRAVRAGDLTRKFARSSTSPLSVMSENSTSTKGAALCRVQETSAYPKRYPIWSERKAGIWDKDRVKGAAEQAKMP
jgi:hypothetical protein